MDEDVLVETSDYRELGVDRVVVGVCVWSSTKGMDLIHERKVDGKKERRKWEDRPIVTFNKLFPERQNALFK